MEVIYILLFAFLILFKKLGSPAHTETISATVTVSDINEFAPSFAAPSYSFNINEEVSAPMILVNVSATDSDYGSNGTVYYELTNDTYVE